MTGVLALILQIIGAAASVAEPLLSGDPVAAAADALAAKLVQIAQAANTAHQQITGQPIDPTLLKPIDPL